MCTNSDGLQPYKYIDVGTKLRTSFLQIVSFVKWASS